MTPKRRVSDNGYEVLVVEDSPTQAAQLAHLLEERGYVVRTAANGEEALISLKQRKPSVVITDITMPGMDGYTLCRTIKAQQDLSDVPVILLTSLSGPQDVLEGLKCGADNFICKPYEEKYLCSRLSHILANQELRKHNKMQIGVELELAGQPHFITADRQQILDLLISASEEAVRANQALDAEHRELVESHQTLNSLYSLAASLNQNNSEREVIETVLERVRALPCVQAVWVHLLDEEGRFYAPSARGLPPALEAPGALEGDCLCRRKFLAGELTGATNILECERFRSAEGDTGGLLCHASVTLEGATAPLGLLNLVRATPGPFSEQELSILQGAGHQIGAALERVRLREGLERLVEKRTEALRAEIEMRKQAEEFFRAVLEATPDAIVGVSNQGRIAVVNEQTEKLFGYRREELLGQAVEILMPDRFRQAQVGHRAGYMSSPQTGTMGATLELYGLHKEGQEFPIEVSLNQQTIGGEALVFSAVRDVTERKQLEMQFRHAQKMEAVGRLAGGVAHDFNNLLSVILGYGDLLLESVPPTDPARPRIVEIRKATERAISLTRQLLAFSRQQVLESRVLNLNTVVTDMDSMLRRLIGEDIALVSKMHPLLGQVKADPGQIEQIMMNLAVNARDAMPGGGKLTIETANVELDDSYVRSHTAVRPGAYVMLAVSDTGQGMDKETQARIFEPFFTTKEKGKGTGLGLSTVFGIVKQSGGDIWVYSEPGRGTTFKIYLPRIEEAAEVARAEASPAIHVTGTETILLAEDEAGVRNLLRELLERQGYEVLEAKDGATAIELAGQHTGPIHLLLTDVVMPGMGGRELAEKVTALRKDVKVIYLSGYTDNAIVHHGVLESDLHFLQKPFTAMALGQKIRQVLDEGKLGSG